MKFLFPLIPVLILKPLLILCVVIGSVIFLLLRVLGLKRVCPLLCRSMLHLVRLLYLTTSRLLLEILIALV